MAVNRWLRPDESGERERAEHHRRAGPEAPFAIPRLPEHPKIPLAKPGAPDSTGSMIRGGFLDEASRRDLTELARDGSAAHRLARRANALVLLDAAMSCEAIAEVLFAGRRYHPYPAPSV